MAVPKRNTQRLYLNSFINSINNTNATDTHFQIFLNQSINNVVGVSIDSITFNNLWPSFYQSAGGIDFRNFDFSAGGVDYQVRCTQYLTSPQQWVQWLNTQSPVVWTYQSPGFPWTYTFGLYANQNVTIGLNSYGFEKMGFRNILGTTSNAFDSVVPWDLAPTSQINVLIQGMPSYSSGQGSFAFTFPITTSFGVNTTYNYQNVSENPNYIDFGRRVTLPQVLDVQLYNCDLMPAETVLSANQKTNACSTEFIMVMTVFCEDQ